MFGLDLPTDLTARLDRLEGFLERIVTAVEELVEIERDKS